MGQLANAYTLFLSLLVEAFPFLLIGVLLSNALRVFVDERQLLSRLPKQPLLAAICGSIGGFLFPACECGNVPVARRLLLKGCSNALAIGFLLAAPVVNPIVLWSTWVAFRDQPEMVWLRLGSTLLIAITLATLFSRQPDLVPFLQKPVATALQLRRQDRSDLLAGGTFLSGGDSLGAIALDRQLAAETEIPRELRWASFLDGSLQELREMGSVLVLGSLVAALIQTAVPRDWLLSLGQNSFTSVLVMIVLALVVSICSTVDAFFALAFAGSFTTGSLLAFLVLGPMVDLKGIGMLLTVFRPRAVAYLVLLPLLLTMAIALLINYHLG